MSERTAPPINDDLRAGLAQLLRGYQYAKDADVDVWEFALEIDSLYETGLRVSDLRWLVTKGYVEHAQEVSVYGDTHRSFRPSAGLNFVPETGFVLTNKGAQFAIPLFDQAASAD